MDSDLREAAILSYIGVPPEREPRPSSSPVEFLHKYLYVLPPHLAAGFSSVTTPKERSVITGIRNRRLAYAETRPKELAFAGAVNKWPHLWSGRARHGEQAGQEEKEWVESGFLGGGAQQVGKLGTLLADYEEEREMRRFKRKHAAEEFVPEEEDSESEGEEESPEEERATFERRVKELFIYGMLEGADYDSADWNELYDVEDETYFDQDEPE